MKTAPRGHHWHQVPVPSSPTTILPSAGVIAFITMEAWLSAESPSTVPFTLLSVAVMVLLPATKDKVEGIERVVVANDARFNPVKSFEIFVPL